MDYKLKYIKYKTNYTALKNKINTQMGGQPKKDKLYFFKANWCGHCNNFKPIWSQLENSNLKNKVEFITLDSEVNKNEMKKYNISGYPTIILKKEDKHIEYEGERSINAIEKFLNENSV